MENGTERYVQTVQALSKLYDTLNSAFFGNELVKPVITVQQDTRNKSYGWWTVKKVWFESTEDDGEYELNICAQHLNRPILETAATLLHEMCHQFASVNNIQDCSRSGNYHNTQFKRIAEAHGLTVEKIPTYGWSHTSLGDYGKSLVSGFIEANPDILLIYRTVDIRRKKVRSSSTRKYICPCCGMSIRATKEVNIVCGDCDQVMIED